MTTLLSGLYKSGARVVVMFGEMYDKKEGRKTLRVGFGTPDKTLDLLAVLRTAGIDEASGFAQKVNISLFDLAQAIEAVRHEIKTRGLTAIAELDQKFGGVRENGAE